MRLSAAEAVLNARTDEDFRDGFPVMGGRLWLDLANTVPIIDGVEQDLIATPATLKAWLAAAGLDGQVRDLSRETVADLAELRGQLRDAVAGLRAGEPVPDGAVAAVNRRLSAVRAWYALRQGEDGAQLATTLETGPAGPAALVALDFARFVCDFEPERLKGCANDHCAMLFYDRGRNNTRRWCSMSQCGNRDKVARFRARKGAASAR